MVIWLTGLPGAGKSTLADRVSEYLKSRGLRIEALDGDVVRGMFPKTGFSKEERDQHIHRVGHLASILERHDVIVVASFISPYREARNAVRAQCRHFIEIYVKASLESCEARDPKGLYKKARAGEIKQFTGIDDPYEAPESPEITVETDRQTEDESFALVRNVLDHYLTYGTTPNR